MFADLLERNQAFAASDARSGVAIMPRQRVIVVCCVDPRVDPAAVLGLRLGDALVIRNAGGRVTDAVLQDVGFLAGMGERMAQPGERLEVAIIHHTQCGTGALANPELRTWMAERLGTSEEVLAGRAVVDPRTTVRIDVERLRGAPQIPDFVAVSGHVHDLESGLVDTVVPSGGAA